MTALTLKSGSLMTSVKAWLGLSPAQNDLKKGFLLVTFFLSTRTEPRPPAQHPAYPAHILRPLPLYIRVLWKRSLLGSRTLLYHPSSQRFRPAIFLWAFPFRVLWLWTTF